MSGVRKAIVLLLVLLLALVPMSGCYDRVELEGIAFVASMGMDKGPGDTIDVTIRIAVPNSAGASTGGAESGGGQVGGTKPITVRAHSLSEAISLMNATVERRISLMHLATVFIGEDLAKDGLINYLRPLTRMREVRRTVRVFMVPGSARETFLVNEPVLEKSIARWQESLTEVGKHTGLVPIKNLHQFITAMESRTEDPIAPIIAVNLKAREGAEPSAADGSGNVVGGGSGGQAGGGEKGAPPKPFKEVTEDENVNYIAGKVIRSGGNNLEFMGTAIFKKDKMVTILDGIDTRMLLAIRGELTRTQMSFPDPIEKGNFVSLELKHSRGPRVEVDLDATPMRVKVNANLEGDLFGSQGSVDYTNPDQMRKLEMYIQQRLIKRQKALIERMFHKYQADPFGIIKETRSQFATSQELREFDFDKKMKTAQIEVDIAFNIRRTGTQLAPITSY